MINIKKKADCCGCTACASVCPHGAITMKEDKEGFLYPIVNTKYCIDCGLCNSVCPINNRKNVSMPLINYGIKALRLKNRSLLERSSSGGAFIAVASYFIREGGIVCGAKYTDNCVVVHGIAETMSEVFEFMGSKYSQSDIRGVYAQLKVYLKAGRHVLFVGTPCQVHGLQLYLKKTYLNLTTIDLVCHAVPSPKLFGEYVDHCSKKLGKRIMAIDMRYKQTYGWGHRFAYRFHFLNGKHTIEPTKVENWGRLFFSRLIDRPSCHECKYTNFNRCGDLTIADFWDDNNMRPEIKSNLGTSLCLINSHNGLNLLDKIKNEVLLWDISKEEAIQPCLLHPTPSNIKRIDFWRDYEKYGFSFVYKKYFTDSYYKRLRKFVKQCLIKVRIWKQKTNKKTF